MYQFIYILCMLDQDLIKVTQLVTGHSTNRLLCISWGWQKIVFTNRSWNLNWMSFWILMITSTRITAKRTLIIITYWICILLLLFVLSFLRVFSILLQFFIIDFLFYKFLSKYLPNVFAIFDIFILFILKYLHDNLKLILIQLKPNK